MARTVITEEIAPGSYAKAGRELFPIAADPTNGNALRMKMDAPMLVILHNTGGAPATATLHTWYDPTKRIGSAIQQIVNAGDFAIFGPIGVMGWRRYDDATVHLDVSSSDVVIATIYLSSSRPKFTSIQDFIVSSDDVVVVQVNNTAIRWR